MGIFNTDETLAGLKRGAEKFGTRVAAAVARRFGERVNAGGGLEEPSDEVRRRVAELWGQGRNLAEIQAELGVEIKSTGGLGQLSESLLSGRFKVLRNGFAPKEQEPYGAGMGGAETGQQSREVPSQALNAAEPAKDRNGKHGYIGYCKGKQYEVYADSSYGAVKKLAAQIGKKESDISVELAEKDVNPETGKGTQVTTFLDNAADCADPVCGHSKNEHKGGGCDYVKKRCECGGFKNSRQNAGSTKITLNGNEYEVETMDQTHVRMRLSGSDKWGIPQHVEQLQPHAITQLQESGVMDEKRYMRNNVMISKQNSGDPKIKANIKRSIEYLTQWLAEDDLRGNQNPGVTDQHEKDLASFKKQLKDFDLENTDSSQLGFDSAQKSTTAGRSNLSNADQCPKCQWYSGYHDGSCPNKSSDKSKNIDMSKVSKSEQESQKAVYGKVADALKKNEADEIANALSPDAAKRILEDLKIGMPDDGGIVVDILSDAEYPKYREAMLALGLTPKTRSNALNNSTYTFRANPGGINQEDVKVDANSEVAAWNKLADEFATPVSDMKRMGVKLIEIKNAAEYGPPAFAPKGSRPRCSQCKHLRDLHANGCEAPGCECSETPENIKENAAEGPDCPCGYQFSGDYREVKCPHCGKLNPSPKPHDDVVMNAAHPEFKAWWDDADRSQRELLLEDLGAGDSHMMATLNFANLPESVKRDAKQYMMTLGNRQNAQTGWVCRDCGKKFTLDQDAESLQHARDTGHQIWMGSDTSKNSRNNTEPTHEYDPNKPGVTKCGKKGPGLHIVSGESDDKSTTTCAACRENSSRNNAGHLGPDSWMAASLEERILWLERAGMDINLATRNFSKLSSDVHVALQDVMDKPGSRNDIRTVNHAFDYERSPKFGFYNTGDKFSGKKFVDWCDCRWPTGDAPRHVDGCQVRGAGDKTPIDRSAPLPKENSEGGYKCPECGKKKDDIDMYSCTECGAEYCDSCASKHRKACKPRENAGPRPFHCQDCSFETMDPDLVEDHEASTGHQMNEKEFGNSSTDKCLDCDHDLSDHPLSGGGECTKCACPKFEGLFPNSKENSGRPGYLVTYDGPKVKNLQVTLRMGDMTDAEIEKYFQNHYVQPTKILKIEKVENSEKPSKENAHPNAEFSKEFHKSCKKCAKCGSNFDGSNDDHTHMDDGRKICDKCATADSKENADVLVPEEHLAKDKEDALEIARHAEGIEHEVNEILKEDETVTNKAGDSLSGADCTCGHAGAKHHDTGRGDACASCDCAVYDPAITCKKCGQKERQGMAVGGLCEECQNSNENRNSGRTLGETKDPLYNQGALGVARGNAKYGSMKNAKFAVGDMVAFEGKTWEIVDLGGTGANGEQWFKLHQEGKALSISAPESSMRKTG